MSYYSISTDKYYALFFLISALSSDRIIATLVKNGFAVEPADGSKYILAENKDWPVAQLVLKIRPPPNIKNDIMPIKDLVSKLVNEIGVKYYSILLTPEVSLAWAFTNIRLSEIKNHRLERINKASHLKLVPLPPPPNDIKTDDPA